jgi:thioester reductase-like protein
MGKTAMIAGATGLVGHYLLELLLQDPSYAKVIALSRHPLTVQNSKLEDAMLATTLPAELSSFHPPQYPRLRD